MITDKRLQSLESKAAALKEKYEEAVAEVQAYKKDKYESASKKLYFKVTNKPLRWADLVFPFNTNAQPPSFARCIKCKYKINNGELFYRGKHLPTILPILKARPELRFTTDPHIFPAIFCHADCLPRYKR